MPQVRGTGAWTAAGPPPAALDFATAAPAALDFAAAARAVLTQLQERCGLGTCIVSRRQGDSFIVLDAVGDAFPIGAGDVLDWDSTFCARMLAGDGPRVAPAVAEVPAYTATAQGLGIDVGALISIPIPDGAGGALGTLCGFDPSPKDAGLADQQALIELWAELLGALLIRELRLEQEVRRAELAETAAGLDPLTGVGNRRLWDRVIAAEEARCRRYGISAAVLVVDLDDLKAVNDRDGHEMGDALLQRTASCLRDTVRACDAVVRLGGDEFAVLAVECDAIAADELAVRVRAALEAADVSASLGLDVRSATGDVSAAWQAADAEMYAVKRLRHAVAASPAPGGLTSPSDRRWIPPQQVTEGAETLDQLLRAAREHLDMDMAIIGEVVGGRYVFRHVNAGGPVAYVPGQIVDGEATYCKRMLDGRMPSIMNDTSDHPEAVAVEAQHRNGIGSYIGVPITFSDGRTFGVMCSLSSDPRATLGGRDADFLRVMARVAGDIIEREDGDAHGRHVIVERLDQVLAPGGLVAVFQPIVALATSEVIGVEALSRFPTDPTRSPQDWFADATTVGASTELEVAAARNALAALDVLDGFVAINFSAQTLLAPVTLRLLEDLPLERIVVEISEREEITDYEPLMERLAPLRERGLRLAVDDAGAGFASFGHILALRPDIIKLDISLIRRIVSDPNRQALAAALTTFGHQAGSPVVAEGIEDAQELAVLRDLGVDWGQGYHLGRPVGLAELTAALTPA